MADRLVGNCVTVTDYLLGCLRTIIGPPAFPTLLSAPSATTSVCTGSQGDAQRHNPDHKFQTHALVLKCTCPRVGPGLFVVCRMRTPGAPPANRKEASGEWH